MPDFLAFVRSRLEPLELPRHRELQIVEELAAQLEDAYDALLARGLSEEDAWRELQRGLPDWKTFAAEVLEAEAAVVRATQPARPPGSLPLRALRAVMRQRPMQGLAGDLRAAFRLLRKDLGFSATTILTLAVCLGANIATFTVVYSVLLRPLPVPNADRIVALGDVYPTVTPNDIFSNTVPAYFDRLEALTAFESQAMFTYWFDTLAIDGTAQELRGMRATPSLFRVLQVQPALGRTFTDAEGEARIGPEDHPEPRVVAAAVRRRPGRSGKGRASRLDGPALHDCRRHAAWLLVLRDGQRRPRAERRRRDPILAAPRVHRRTAIRRRPHAVWLLSHRPARAGGNDRAGARAGRSVERAHVRAVSAVPLRRAPRVHGRHAAPGSAHRHRQARPVSALGRRRIRAA